MPIATEYQADPLPVATEYQVNPLPVATEYQADPLPMATKSNWLHLVASRDASCNTETHVHIDLFIDLHDNICNACYLGAHGN